MKELTPEWLARFWRVLLQIDKPWDESRCRICGWPLAKTLEDGCVACSCCMRPVPERRADSPMVWSPSLDGEATKEVRDFMREKLPEKWENYCDDCFVLFRYDKASAAECNEKLMSLSNLTTWLIENNGFMFEECKSPDRHFPTNDEESCRGSLSCSVTCNREGMEGYIAKKQYAEALKMIKEGR